MRRKSDHFFVQALRNSPVWAVLAFCFLRSVEVLFIQQPLSFISLGVALSASLFSVIIYLRSVRDGRFAWSRDHTLVAVLVGWVSFASIAQILSTQDLVDLIGRSSHEYLLKTTLVVFTWFFAGAAAGFYRAESKNIGFALLLIALLFLVVNATSFGLTVQYANILDSGGFENLNHLLLAEYMLIICYFGYFAAPLSLRFLFFLIISYILFAGGGRASFFLGIGSLLVYEALFGARRLALSMLLCAFLLLFLVTALGDDPIVSYMLLTGGLESDSSFAGRLYQFIDGVDALGGQIAWGDVSFFVKKFGSLGFYMHNFMSAWQFYGLVGMLIYLAVGVVSAIKMWLVLRYSTEYLDYVFAALLIYSLVGIVLVKFVGFGTFWFATGYWILKRPFRVGL